MRLIVPRGALLALSGIAIGAMASFWTTRALRTLLFEVGNVDAMTYVAAAVVLALAAIIASLVPAGRAARVQPASSVL